VTSLSSAARYLHEFDPKYHFHNLSELPYPAQVVAVEPVPRRIFQEVNLPHLFAVLVQRGGTIGKFDEDRRLREQIVQGKRPEG